MAVINRIVGSRRTLNANPADAESGPTGDGLLLEDESGFILTEDGDYIIEE